MAPESPMGTKQAANYLGLSKSTVEKLRHFGGGPRYLKLGHLVRYRPADLDEWMTERLIGSTSEKPATAGSD
ncbi:helix-turn-helix transcriptional regulator [Sphingomonas xanthus]|uniref:Helix-turn-helix domain-containing protein n=1 Tax=Sphingomonas xanthus TaxID=2594473 RepID=A0A516IP58_9SPHN|nr:helix-turn-helix domain-containing protein [Sphingomonas xanthus]QDP18700.1 helix-turn-helix domain-containing protein [Sphingomonas xanthus]